MDNKEFIPYQPSIDMKELGFNEPCFAYYLEDGTQVPASYSKQGTVYPSNADLLPEWCSAPTFSQAFRFFREKYQLHLTITSISQESWQWHITKPGESLGKLYDEDFYTYEEAELACLIKLIEIANEKGI